MIRVMRFPLLGSGFATVAISDQTAHVQYVYIDPRFRKKGLAGKAYRRIGADLAQQGIRLQSSPAMHEWAVKIWQRLETEGLAELTGETDGSLLPAKGGVIKQVMPCYRWRIA